MRAHAHASYEIALHPIAQVRIAEEVHATLATRTAFDYDDLQQLKYTEMVLKEVRKKRKSIMMTHACAPLIANAKKVSPVACPHIPGDALAPTGSVLWPLHTSAHPRW